MELWGTGKPRREILCSDELADGCLYFMQNYEGNEPINIGTGQDHTIEEWAEMLKGISGFKGGITYDASKPDGVSQKIVDISKAKALGWQAKVDQKSNLKRVYEDFVKNYQSLINK
jgi:GDP-L-fucose synthase